MKKSYKISGFDCPNCASKSEKHLNNHEKIESAVIDFNNERLYVTYKDEELSIDELISIIHEVEEDPIVITNLEDKEEEKERLFDKDSIILLIRIITIIILMVMAKILENPFGDRSWQVIVLYSIALLIGIYDIVFEVFSNIFHRVNPVDEKLLMFISCTGAFLIALFPNAEPVFFDGVMVLALFQIGELIEEILSKKSKDAIRNAIDLRADKANLVNEDKVIEVHPSQLKIDDEIIIKVGEIIPVDGLVIKGNGSLDASSLTGEAMPVNVKEDDHVLSGTILTSGSLTLKVEKEFKSSTISKIMELVESSGEKKSKVDKFITRFARIYTPIILLIAVLFTVIYGLVSKNWENALYNGVFILIIGCPCAIVISIPLAYFAGIGLASKNGIVVKGAAHLDQLCHVGTLFIDKTGTLTYGSFKVSKLSPNNISEEEFNKYLLAAECRSEHPIAKAIIKDHDVDDLIIKQEEYEEIAGYGVHTRYEGHDIYAGNKELLINQGINVPVNNEIGSLVYLSVDGKYAGYALLNDVIREESKEFIQHLKSLGIKTVLLSGDNIENVANVAKEVGMDEYHGKLLPQNKTELIEEEINKKEKGYVIFAGDGINDTPSIIRADVGFAMGGVGSDVAIENADVVIMKDNPMKIYHTIKIAKITRNVAIFNIIFAITIKLIAMILTMLSGSVISFPPHVIPIIDALSDTGLTVLLVINSLLIIYRKIK